MTKHRAKLARERAGLSIGQACAKLDIEREVLIWLEGMDSAFADPDNRDVREAMADVYGVNPEWLAGDRELRDYAHVDGIRGAELLTSHDRDIIAEFVAAMPRKPAKTLDRIAAERSKPK
jgi:transcriptional regulator with XRE-family HTH domain